MEKWQGKSPQKYQLGYILGVKKKRVVLSPNHMAALGTAHAAHGEKCAL